MASEADLLKLHAQLESSASARGGGGLGFEKMSGKRKDGQTKASKLLQKQQKREFASTTAGHTLCGSLARACQPSPSSAGRSCLCSHSIDLYKRGSYVLEGVEYVT
eukprot:1232808-Pleurochrysis_carterae.AAC.2